MKLCKCIALIDTVCDNKFIRGGTVFTTSLSEAIRLGGNVQRREVFDEPEPPPPAPPKSGTYTTGADEPPNNRMIKSSKHRIVDASLPKTVE